MCSVGSILPFEVATLDTLLFCLKRRIKVSNNLLLVDSLSMEACIMNSEHRISYCGFLSVFVAF